MQKQIVISLSALLLLSACGTPEVDQTAAHFNEIEFTADLNDCRGGAFIEASAKSIGIAMLGSAYGALYGAEIGARDSDTAEGAAIGAAIGGTLGLTVAALKALEKHEEDIAGCLLQKGYRVAG